MWAQKCSVTDLTSTVVSFLVFFCGMESDFNLLLCFFLSGAGSSVIIHDDPTSRGPTAVATDTTAAGPQSSTAPSAAPAAESTHVTPGNI